MKGRLGTRGLTAVLFGAAVVLLAPASTFATSSPTAVSHQSTKAALPVRPGHAGSLWTRRPGQRRVPELARIVRSRVHAAHRWPTTPEASTPGHTPARASKWYPGRRPTLHRFSAKSSALPRTAVAHTARWSTPSLHRRVLELSRVQGSRRLIDLGTGRALKPGLRGASLVVNGGGLDDTLIVDFRHGNPVPSGGLTFNGGGHVSRAGNVLVIRGGSFRRVVYDYVNAHDGSVRLDGAQIRYTGLQPLVNSGSAANIVFNLPAAPPYGTFLEDDGTPGNNTSQLRSSPAHFETTTFTNPTSSLTINGGSGQTVTVNTVDSFGSANLAISNPDSITVDQFQTSGTTALTTNGAISEGAPGALVTGKLVTSGHGSVSLTGAANAIGTAASNDWGTYSLFDGKPAGLTVGSVNGVNGITTLFAAISVTTGGAKLTLANAVANFGAAVTLAADGMSLSGGLINAGSGVVELQPYTGGRAIDLGTNPSTGKLGLSSADLAVISAGVLRIGDLSVTGNIAVTAPITAPAGWSTLSLLTSIAGGISQGVGDSISVASLNASGFSFVSLPDAGNAVGTVAGASGGTWIFTDSGDATLGSADPTLGFGFGVGIIDSSGAVTLTLAGSHQLTLAAGIDTTHSFGGPSPGGPVTLVADTMSLSGGSVNAGNSVVELHPDTSGRAIDLGTNPSGGNLGLSNADLAVITAGVLRVGDLGTTGNIVITAAIVPHAGWSSLSLLTAVGGAISQNSGATLTVASLNAAGASSVLLAQSNAIGTVAGASLGSWVLIDSPTATVGSVDPTLGSGFGVGVIGGGPVTILDGAAVHVASGINTTYFGGSSNVAVLAGTIDIGATVNTGSATTILNASTLSSESASGALVTGNLVTVGDQVSLNGSSNAIGTAASNATGSYSLSDALPAGLTVGSVNGVDGITTSAAPISVTTSGATLTLSKALTSGGGAVTLAADGMSLAGGSVNAGGGLVELQPYSAGRAVDLGTNPSAGKLGLSSADLNVITAGVLRIGNLFTTGNITVSAPITHPAGWSSLSLLTGIGHSISQGGADSLTVPALNAAGFSSVTLTAAGNAVGTVAGASGGAWKFVDSQNATVGSVDPGLGFAGVLGGGPVNISAGAHTISLAAPIDTTAFGGSGGAVNLTADGMSLTGGSVNAGSGAVGLKPSTAGRGIDLGTNPSAGKLGLSNADLGVISAGVLRVGNLTTVGPITVSAPISPASATTLSLETPKAIVDGAWAITVANLALRAGTGVGALLHTAVSKLAWKNGAGKVAISNTGALTIAAVDGLSSSSNKGTTTTLSASSPITFAVNTTSGGSLSATTTETGSELGTPLPPPDDDLTVNGGVTVRSTAGNVTLISGDSTVLQTGSTVRSDTGNISLTAGSGDNDNDASATLNGTLRTPHKLQVTGAGTLGPSATFAVFAKGAAKPGLDYTQMVAKANLHLGGALTLSLGYSPTPTDKLTIVNDPAGTITGTFKGLPEGSAIKTGGKVWQIHYAAHFVRLNFVTAPSNTGLPVITGIPEPAHPLSCSNGIWKGTSPTFTRQWTKDGANIPGATAPKYTPVAGDAGHLLRCKVTAKNAAGHATAISAGHLIYSKDGSGAIARTPASVAHATAGKTVTFTYTTPAGGISKGALTITVPTGWTAPQHSNPAAPGYASSSLGAVTISSRTITVSGLTRAAGQTVTITYKNASTPATAVGVQTWLTDERSTLNGVLTKLAAQPAITVT